MIVPLKLLFGKVPPAFKKPRLRHVVNGFHRHHAHHFAADNNFYLTDVVAFGHRGNERYGAKDGFHFFAAFHREQGIGGRARLHFGRGALLHREEADFIGIERARQGEND